MTNKRKEKVILLGAGHTWEQAPLDDPSFEVWMLNAFFRNTWRGEKVSCEKYASRWFQIHQPGSAEGHIDDLDSIDWMKKWNRGPIYMVNKFPDYPASVRYPFEEVTRRMGPYDYLKQQRRAYYTNTVDYMVALAAVEGFAEIDLYGISMIADTDNEWAEQRTSLSYYLGSHLGRAGSFVLLGSTVSKSSRTTSIKMCAIGSSTARSVTIKWMIIENDTAQPKR
jgi:hypothetical protein